MLGLSELPNPDAGENAADDTMNAIKSELCYFEKSSNEVASFKVEQKLFSDSELLNDSTPVECTSLEEFIWWSQVKQAFPDCARRLVNFQDSGVDAPLSHKFVLSLAAQGPHTLLGVRDWPCSEGGQETVRLHIECVAAGTRNADPAANRIRHKVMRLLLKEFNKSYLPGPAMAGRNLRHDTERKMPLNLDNRSALHIALLDGSDGSVIGAAVLYIHGPAFGYLPFFAISQDHRGQGVGSKFAWALVGVLRHLSVDALVLEASVNPATRDQRVVRFWETKVGFARASDEYFDCQEKLTNISRHSRVSGWAIRAMSGVYGFPDGCIMFRGTKRGWRVGDSDVALPVGLCEAAVSYSISAVHDDIQMDCQTLPTSRGSDAGTTSSPGECSGELSTWSQVPLTCLTLQTSMDKKDTCSALNAEGSGGSQDGTYRPDEDNTSLRAELVSYCLP